MAESSTTPGPNQGSMTSFLLRSRLDDLYSWTTAHGTTLHPSISLSVSPDSGASFIVHKDAPTIQPGEALVSCPPAITLSYLNAVDEGKIFTSHTVDSNDTDEDGNGGWRVEDRFPDSFMRTVPPHIVGRFFLMQQHLLGKDSFWYPYIATLPQPTPITTAKTALQEGEEKDGMQGEQFHAWQLPAFYPPRLRALLRGTNVGSSIQTMRDNVEKEHKQGVLALKEHYNKTESDHDVNTSTYQNQAPLGHQLLESSYTLTLYQWAFCIFTTRSFRPCLVLEESTLTSTLADLSLKSARRPENMRVSSAGKTKDVGRKKLVRAVKENDFSVLLPLYDIGNHHPAAPTTWDMSNLSSGVILRSARGYRPGEEVYNCYGKKTNAELVLSYGFLWPAPQELLSGGHDESLREDTVAETRDAPVEKVTATKTKNQDKENGKKNEGETEESWTYPPAHCTYIHIRTVAKGPTSSPASPPPHLPPQHSDSSPTSSSTLKCQRSSSPPSPSPSQSSFSPSDDETTKTDRIISLLPLSNPSSHRGHTTTIIPPSTLHSPGFAHIQQELIWDILSLMAPPHIIDSIFSIPPRADCEPWVSDPKTNPPTREEDIRRKLPYILGPEVPPCEDAQEILFICRKVLRGKMDLELEKLEALDSEAEQMAKEYGADGRIKLILSYREDCRRGLLAARASIVGVDGEIIGESEEDH